MDEYFQPKRKVQAEISYVDFPSQQEGQSKIQGITGENLNLLQKGYSDIDKNLVYKIFNSKKITAKIFNKNFIDIGTKKSLKKAPKFINKTLNKPCCFLDRDGVINEEKNYVHKHIGKTNFLHSQLFC